MPNDISTIDRTFPDLSGEEGLEAKVTRLTDWAFKLYESLRYTLYNLGGDTQRNGAAFDNVSDIGEN